MKFLLEALFQEVSKILQYQEVPFEIARPENPLHGDYSTNVAFLLGRVQKKSPVTIAHEFVDFLILQKKHFESKECNHKTSKCILNASEKLSSYLLLQDISKMEVAGPGFINLHVTEQSLINQTVKLLSLKETVATTKKVNFLIDNKQSVIKDKRIMVEFAHPNTHKAFHIGHLRNITTGESLVRLLERVGNEVIRANYQGDVGMHIAKCLYGITVYPELKQEYETVKFQPNIKENVTFLGKAYAIGSQAYEGSDEVKTQVGKVNKQIYGKDPVIYPL